MLTVCDLEHQDSSLSRLFLSNINKRSAHNIEGVPGVSTFSQGARGQADSLLSLTELVAMNDCVCMSEREREEIHVEMFFFWGGEGDSARERERNRVDECQSIYYLNVCNELHVHVYVIAVKMHVHVHLPSNEF